MERVCQFLKDAGTYYIATCEDNRPVCARSERHTSLRASSISRPERKRSFQSRLKKIRMLSFALSTATPGCAFAVSLLRTTAEKRGSQCLTPIRSLKRSMTRTTATLRCFTSKTPLQRSPHSQSRQKLFAFKSRKTEQLFLFTQSCVGTDPHRTAFFQNRLQIHVFIFKAASELSLTFYTIFDY